MEKINKKIDTKLEAVGFITPTYIKRLKKLKIETIEDLLKHFPSRYEDLSTIAKVKDIQKNIFQFQNQIVTIKGTAKNPVMRNTYSNGRPFCIVEANIEDETSNIKCVWFNQPYILKTLLDNKEFFVSGKINIKNHKITLSSPELEVYKTNKTPVHTARITPIYPETYGVSSKWLRYAIHKILYEIKPDIKELLPEDILNKNNLLTKEEALSKIHFPEKIKDAEISKKRLSFEEMLILQLGIQRYKTQTQKNKAPKIKKNIPLIQGIIKNLSFTLTDSQKKAIWRIIQDTDKQYPMNRLLSGDVGSGKTIVACIVALNTIKSGYRVALMSPTEILAQQHYKTIKEICDQYKIKVSLITRTKKDSPENKMLIGTHSLIQKKINIDDLGLLIIDEQHKFGVAQRANLIKKSNEQKPHLLSMTATPIPRTLSLTIYGDLDISQLNEMPKQRKKVITKYIPENNRNEALKKTYEEIEKGHQAFIIVPLVEESESIKTKNATKEYQRLSKEDFSKYKLGLIHGQMKQKEKDETMERFRDNKINALVSTSIVEVGVDIPNATVMIIEGAERFGLAQLHQFRGRIGRSNLQSYCFLFTTNAYASEKTRERISAFIKAKSGYELANYDMRIRGAGNIYSTQQSGMSSMLLASLMDYQTIQLASKEAQNLLRQDINLKKYSLLNKEVKKIEIILHLE